MKEFLNKIINGDSLDVLATMPENSIDLIFADPPYFLSNDGFSGVFGEDVNKGEWDRSAGYESDFAYHVNWITACRRVLKPEGSIWISGTRHSIFQCGAALQMLDFHLLNDICWYKPATTPNFSCRMFTATHETLIWARKSADAKHCFNYTDMKGGRWHVDDALKTRDLQMRSVWSIKMTPQSEKVGGHPTQKPLALLSRIIQATSRPGDIVLDPFSGAGTTAVAAKHAGRQYVGIELDPAYCKAAETRLAQGELFS